MSQYKFGSLQMSLRKRWRSCQLVIGTKTKKWPHEGIDTPFRSDLYPNPSILMTIKSSVIKMISVLCELNKQMNPKMGWNNSSPSPTMTQEPSLKAHFWLNLAETYKMCVHWVYDAYIPNLWCTYLLDRSLKSLHFNFGEILGQPG